MKLAVSIPLFILLLLLGSATGENSNCPNPLIDSVAIVRCIGIVDGDTWKFKLQNDIFSVRVLGLDTYETKRNERLTKQAQANGISIDSAYSLGLKANHYADSLLMNQDITIIRDFNEKNFDFYNRLLRRCLVNGSNYAEILINQGLTTK
ncbi:MAG: hypothetical protein WC389_12235 [Lutibacter sp.]|jgi:endonuclease YncB( thermonuclease family)